MMELVLIAAGFGVLLLIGVALLGWFVLPSHAREEIRPRVRTFVSIFVVGALAAGAAWAPLTSSLQKSAVDLILEEYCDGATEQIFRTVQAEGLIVQAPVHDYAGAFHEEDRRPDAYLRRPQRPYRYLEVGSYIPGGPVRYFEANQSSWPPAVNPTRRSRYGLTWRPTIRVYDSYADVHGDETQIIDLDTSEILARRVTYYAVHRGGRGGDDTYRVCPQVDLGSSPHFIDGRTRDSYNFVSRVIVPPY